MPVWKKITHAAPFYVLFCDQAGYNISLTNFVQMWTNNIPTDQSFVQILKESNEGLEFADENEFLEKGKHMLHATEKLKDVKVMIDVNEQAVLNLLTMEYNFPFRLNLKLSKSSDTMFFDMVTQRLLQSIHDLKKSQEDLYLKLKKKDMELERYRDEEIKISKHLRSENFDEEEHSKKHATYEKSFSTPYVPEILLEPHWHKRLLIEADTRIVKLLKTEQSHETATDHSGPSKARLNNTQINSSVAIKIEPIKEERNTESENIEIPLIPNEQCAQNKRNVKTETVDNACASNALQTAPVSAEIKVKKEEIKTEMSGGGNRRKRKKGLNF